jgi:peptidoglycan/LPS O-acetylase OafA/YrhL
LTPVAQALPADRRRLDFLDCLRGLAAAYVVVYHMVLLPDPHLGVPRWAEKFALSGGMGVTLFFIVSAFSLYYTMPLRLRERSPTASFYLHRFFRIAPLFYFLVLLTLVRDHFVFGVQHGPLEVLQSLTFVFNLVPGGQEGFVWAGWTIGVEMVFYAVFPLIYFRVRNTGNAIAFVFACLLAWIAVQLALEYAVMADATRQSILRWSALRHFPVFATGIVLFHLFERWQLAHPDAERLRPVGNALLLASAFAFTALLQGWLPNVFGDAYYWQAVIFGGLFLGLAMAPWRWVVNGATSFLGKTSYSIYLNHTTIVFFLKPVYAMLYARLPLNLAFLASVVLTFSIVLPVSYVTYRWVELPGIALGKRVASRMRVRAQPAINPT